MRTIGELPVVRAALAEAIDYAGLFPPASLTMEAATQAYDAYREGPDAWALGRFVLPVGRLDAFAEAAGRATPDSREPWRLSGVVGADASRVPAIESFNRLYGARWSIDTVEAQAGTIEQVLSHRAYGDAGLLTFVEVPLTGDLEALVGAIRKIGARGKIRTGGITVEAFPSSRDVLRFIRACHRASLPFKATAGLHHPVRGQYPLTYDAESEQGTMFGYLNMISASALVRAGSDDGDALAALEATGVDALRLSDDALRIGALQVSNDVLRRTRAEFMVGFGSCSFREPLDDLAPMAVP